MKERWLIYVVVVLLVINAAALVTIAFHRFAPPSENSFGRRLRSEQRPFPRLGLSPQQRDALRAYRLSSDSLMSPQVSSINEKRRLLFTELANDNPDTVAINGLLDEIGKLQITIQKRLVEKFMTGGKVFSPEQRRLMLEMIEQRAHWQEPVPRNRMQGDDRPF